MSELNNMCKNNIDICIHGISAQRREDLFGNFPQAEDSTDQEVDKLHGGGDRRTNGQTRRGQYESKGEEKQSEEGI
eukprot:753731-Heterocapsa_arctica.AAC.1